LEYKNILITGGAGFIGSNLALKLLSKGYLVTVLDNLSHQIHGTDPSKSPLYSSIKDKVNFVNGTVLSRDDWRLALNGIDIVVHLAAETGTGQSMYEIEKYTDVNVKGTSIFLDILTNEVHTVKKIVVASSRAVYGEGKYLCKDHGVVYPLLRQDYDMANAYFDCRCPKCGEKVQALATDELSQINPMSIYAITKQVQEQMCMIIGKSLGIPAVAFRYQNVYGAGQSLSNPYTGILSIFSTRIRSHSPINIFEDGIESRDFVYVDDAVDATILGIERVEANNEIFNVGSGIPVSVIDIAKELRAAYGVDVKIDVSAEYRVGDIRHNFADLSKIRKVLNFSTKISMKEGVSRFASWVNKQHLGRDIYNKSVEELKLRGLYKKSI
jgi:dTDP-L-rhamnose 4-epimerase